MTKKKKDKNKTDAPAPEAAETADEQAAETDQVDPTEALQAERDEMYERLQRVSADYQNYMRRSQDQLGKQINHARGDVIKQFFTVLDHFDTALERQPTGDEAKALHDGVRIVRDEFLRVMQQAGVERIEANVGDVFDPTRHEAMLRQPADGVGPNCISAAFQPGYMMGEVTLRPAKVAVAPEAPAEPVEQPADDERDED